MGVMNPRLGLFGTSMSALDEVELPAGNVAVISQSGAFGTHAALLLRDRGHDLSLWCTTGNECDVDVADGIACAARDEDTEVIVAYLEGCRNLEKLEAALAVAAETRKPIVVLKTGRSAAGAAAARAHTAADTGDDTSFSEMFERCGVHRARTIEELIDVAGACAADAFPNGRRAGLMTISGGVGVVMADAAVRAGLEVAPMPVPVQSEIKALLPFASARNPIDCTAQVFDDWSLFDHLLDAVVRRGGYDSIVLFLATIGADPAMMEPLMSRLEKVRAAHPDRVMALSLIIDGERRSRLERAGFLVFEDPTRAVNTVAALSHIGSTTCSGAGPARRGPARSRRAGGARRCSGSTDAAGPLATPPSGRPRRGPGGAGRGRWRARPRPRRDVRPRPPRGDGTGVRTSRSTSARGQAASRRFIASTAGKDLVE